MSIRSTLLAVVEVLALVAAVVVAALTSTPADWEPPALVVVLLVLALTSDLFAVSYQGQRISRRSKSGLRPCLSSSGGRVGRSDPSCTKSRPRCTQVLSRNGVGFRRFRYLATSPPCVAAPAPQAIAIARSGSRQPATGPLSCAW